jgi:hypothetical protein
MRQQKSTINDRVIETKIVYSDVEANRLLSGGWRLYGTPIWSENLCSIVMVMVLLEDSE